MINDSFIKIKKGCGTCRNQHHCDLKEMIGPRPYDKYAKWFWCRKSQMALYYADIQASGKASDFAVLFMVD